jgi:hypothetical protein
MEGFDQGVSTPESPTGIDPSVATDPSSAGTQNTEQQGQVTDNRGNVIPSWRVNELVERASERALAQAEARFAQERQQLLQSFDQRSQAQQQTIMQALQQRAHAPSRTPEQEQERQQAQSALNGLLTDHPEWRQMQTYAKAGPALAQAALQIPQLQQQLAHTYTIAGENTLYRLATAAGLSTTEQDFAQLNDDVAAVIARSPEAVAAFLSGDQRIVPAAFKMVRDQTAARDQRARAQVAQTKATTQRLPPRMGGRQPGSPPMPKFDPKDPRGSMAKIHAGAEADLMARLG